MQHCNTTFRHAPQAGLHRHGQVRPLAVGWVRVGVCPAFCGCPVLAQSRRQTPMPSCDEKGQCCSPDAEFVDNPCNCDTGRRGGRICQSCHKMAPGVCGTAGVTEASQLGLQHLFYQGRDKQLSYCNPTSIFPFVTSFGSLLHLTSTALLHRGQSCRAMPWRGRRGMTPLFRRDASVPLPEGAEQRFYSFLHRGGVMLASLSWRLGGLDAACR